MLISLLKVNLIKSFTIKNNLIHLEFNSIKNKFFYKNLTNFYNIRNKRVFRLKFLKKFHFFNNSSTYILSTSRGFLTQREAINNQIGGILFFKLTS